MNISRKKLKVTCIFHKGCMDGWMSALPIWQAYHQIAELKFVPAHYSDTPPVVDGDDYVFIVDFSYKPEVMVNWFTGKAEVFLIDHHTKAIRELIDHSALGFTPGPVLDNGQVYDSSNFLLTAYLAFNDGKDFKDQSSGAGLVLSFLERYRGAINVGSMTGLAWDDIRNTSAISQSYDLWHHNGEEMHQNTFLSMFFKNWEKTNRQKFNRMVQYPEESHALMMELSHSWMSESLRDKLDYGKHVTLEHGIKCRALCNTAYQVNLPVTGMPYMKVGFIPGESLDVSVSTLGSIAVREYSWDVMVMIAAVKDKEYILSMRSNENGRNIDVAEICDQIGKGPYGLSGGGHRNAAGCTIRKVDIQEVLSEVLSL